MLKASADQIRARLRGTDLVLDVGGWGKPFPRADWVLDLMPYETRGVYGDRGDEPERFSAQTWIERDICDRERWPFDDGQFDYAICSHTLEDVRDPVWVCSELNRVAKAGYIEVPSRLEEQAWGVAGQWVGWSHHHWLVDIEGSEITFVLKPHVLHGRESYHLPPPLGAVLSDSERVQSLFWDGEFCYRERIFFDHEEFEEYLTRVVRENRDRLQERVPKPTRGARVKAALARR